MYKILQLKPKDNAFLKMARDITGRLDIIFVCEGKRDVEVLKGVIGKIFGELMCNLAVTDCEGKDAISEATLYTATLATVSRRLKVIAILIDADEYKPEHRANSITNSLRARLEDVHTIKISDDVFEIRSQRLNVKIFVKVVGDLLLPFEKHTIDDYITRLLILENEIEESEITVFRSSKEIVDEFLRHNNVSVKELILNAEEKNVQNAFENIVNYVRLVLK